MTPGLCTGRDHTGSAVVPAGDADTVHRSSVTALRKSDILLPFSPKIPAGVLLFTLLLSKFKFRTGHETSTIDVAGLPPTPAWEARAMSLGFHLGKCKSIMWEVPQTQEAIQIMWGWPQSTAELPSTRICAMCPGALSVKLIDIKFWFICFTFWRFLFLAGLQTTQPQKIPHCKTSRNSGKNLSRTPLKGITDLDK